jgi:hypothetical protein
MIDPLFSGSEDDADPPAVEVTEVAADSAYDDPPPPPPAPA